MQGGEGLSSLAFILGLLLVLLGLILMAAPLLSKIVGSLERVHPLLLWGVRIDGVFVGTSPLLIIVLILIFLLLRYWRW
ncbi:hypothetical protein HRbin01_01316 [archaeon HR01]|nr:hypothetical protein HRbin01_01316 [archaeon HR01]